MIYDVYIYEWYGDDAGLQQHTCTGTIYEVGPMVCYMFIFNRLRKPRHTHRHTHTHIYIYYVYTYIYKLQTIYRKKSNCSLSSNKSSNKHHEINTRWVETKKSWNDSDVTRPRPYNSKTHIQTSETKQPHLTAFIDGFPFWPLNNLFRMGQETSIQWERRSTSKSSLQINCWQKIQRPTQIIQDDNPPARERETTPKAYEGVWNHSDLRYCWC